MTCVCVWGDAGAGPFYQQPKEQPSKHGGFTVPPLPSPVNGADASTQDATAGGQQPGGSSRSEEQAGSLAAADAVVALSFASVLYRWCKFRISRQPSCAAAAPAPAPAADIAVVSAAHLHVGRAVRAYSAWCDPIAALAYPHQHRRAADGLRGVHALLRAWRICICS